MMQVAWAPPILLFTGFATAGTPTHIIDLDHSPVGLVTTIATDPPTNLYVRRGLDRNGDGLEDLLLWRSDFAYQVNGRLEPEVTITPTEGVLSTRIPFAADFYLGDTQPEVFLEDNMGCSEKVLFGPNPLPVAANISQASDSPGFRFCGGSPLRNILDVNGDNISDIAVSLPGRLGVVFGIDRWTGGLFALDALNFGSLSGAVFYSAGPVRELHGLGDVNDDGVDDLSIYVDTSSYVLFGPVIAGMGYSHPDDFMAPAFSRVTYQEPGGSELVVGDLLGQFSFNGDPFPDLLFSMITYSAPGAAEVGKACVLFGGSDPWPGEINVAAIPVTDRFCVTGTEAGRSFGQQKVTLRDLNGDGFDDFLVKVEQPDELVVVFGRPGGGDMALPEIDVDSGRILRSTSIGGVAPERIDNFDGDRFGEFALKRDNAVWLVRGSRINFGPENLLRDGFED